MAIRKLAWGYTTGTCAQAATKAAMEMLLTGRRVEEVHVRIPNGEELKLEILEIRCHDSDPVTALPRDVSCGVRKDSGDDPDVTDGMLIFSRVRRMEKPGILIEGGAGVGRVTREGLELPVGSPAINRVPREMILREVTEAMEETGTVCGIRVEISIPGGEERAKKTFNPRLGIEGGLSILGTSGRVEPMSEQALIETIRLEMQVKAAEGRRYLVAAPGNYGLDFLREAYGIPETEVVKCSNYIGQTIDLASELNLKGLLLAGHIGKLIKAAGGIMNTHSRWADCRMELLAAAALRAGLSGERAAKMLEAVTTEEALGIWNAKERGKLMAAVMKKMEEYLNYRAEGELQIEAVVYSPAYGILGKTRGADRMLREYRKNRKDD